MNGINASNNTSGVSPWRRSNINTILSFLEEDIITSNECGSFISGKLLLKFSIGKPGTYALNSSINDSQGKFAVALSNCTVKIYDLNGRLLDECVHDKDVTDVKFCSTHPSYLFTSSLDGKIAVWDSRCQGIVQTFKDDSTDVLKPLLCFDYNVDEYLLCAGTELIREDSFLLFWDQRASKILGGYWNSHTDDITQVKFHPSKNSYMASSGVDGLINVFDLNEKTEADAIKYTLNVECAVNKFCWKQNKDVIYCITSIEGYQMWAVNDVSPLYTITREEMPINII